jgi:hypothetical protein
METFMRWLPRYAFLCHLMSCSLHAPAKRTLQHEISKEHVMLCCVADRRPHSTCTTWVTHSIHVNVCCPASMPATQQELGEYFQSAEGAGAFRIALGKYLMVRGRGKRVWGSALHDALRPCQSQSQSQAWSLLLLSAATPWSPTAQA